MNYNEELVKSFMNADKEFQESDLYLLGLLECASSHAAIKAQEKTINAIIEWITNEQMSLYMQNIGNQIIHFQKEHFIKELKKQFKA